ncbi:hypothetical protein ACFW04_000330 [Cataglyphis niger]
MQNYINYCFIIIGANQAMKRNLDQYVDEYRVRDTDRQLRLLIDELTNRLTQHAANDERLLDAIRDRIVVHDEILNSPNADQENKLLGHTGDGHQVRNLDQIGGGHLVRNLDQIGGGHLVRNLDQIGGGHLVRNLDQIGGGHLLRSLDRTRGAQLAGNFDQIDDDGDFLDQIRGASLARNLDHIGGGHLVRNLDQIGGGNLVRSVDSSNVDQFVAPSIAAVSRQMQLEQSLDRARSNNRLKNIE